MSQLPLVTIWFEVPDDCRMQGEIDGDHNLHITFGEMSADQNLIFRRQALERFVKLATELLAMELPDDVKAVLPVLVV